MTPASRAKQLRGRGRPLLLLFAIAICQPLTQAFCGIGPTGRGTVSLRAEAKPKSPVKELEAKLSKALGRKVNKADMVWTYQASVELPCFNNLKVSMDANTADECKRKAAAAMLEVVDFEKLAAAAEAKATPEEAKQKSDGGAKKGAKKEGKDAKQDPKEDLEIGQELKMKVIRRTRNGLRLDWKGKEVALPASELSGTFPVDVPRRGQNLKVRVLSKERGVVVTMREGSLERPEKVDVQADLSALDGVDSSTKMEAEVLGFTFQDAVVKVTGSNGKVTLAQLPRKQFSEGAEKEMAVGSKIQVRKKYLTKDRVLVSMKDPPSRKPEELQPGEELTGTVESILRVSKPALFLDVGFDRPAYLDWQETSDTYPGKAFNRLKVGKDVDCRVLKVDGDRIYVTCRSGDLYRPTFSEKPPQAVEEIAEKFRSLPKGSYLDARVLRLTPKYAVVTVKTPDGIEAEGYIPRGFQSASFEETGAPNDAVKVQLLPEQPKATGKRQRVMLTMKDAKEPTEVKEAEVKETSGKAETVQEEVVEAAEEPASPAETEKTEAPPASKEDEGPLKGLSDFLLR